jgi:hypothetical protein
VSWGGQSDALFAALSVDFMKPVVDVVDALLMGGQINVTVYNGKCRPPGSRCCLHCVRWWWLPTGRLLLPRRSPPPPPVP